MGLDRFRSSWCSGGGGGGSQQQSCGPLSHPGPSREKVLLLGPRQSAGSMPTLRVPEKPPRPQATSVVPRSQLTLVWMGALSRQLGRPGVGGSDKAGMREGEKEVPPALKTVAAPQLT